MLHLIAAIPTTLLAAALLAAVLRHACTPPGQHRRRLLRRRPPARPVRVPVTHALARIRAAGALTGPTPAPPARDLVCAGQERPC